jgi:hypothetical protein
MILRFSTQIKGKPTKFVEKILKNFIQTEFFYTNNESMQMGGNLDIHYCLDCRPKLHTIREDKNNRWKPGTMIDFFINARQKNMFRFAPKIPVVSEQKIEINWFCKKEYEPFYWWKNVTICVDDVYLSCEQCIELAQNDGFDTIEDFFNYFNKNYKGKIIHWTDLRY